MPGCEATPGTDHPDSSEDSGCSTSAVPDLSGRRACCDAASLFQQAQKTVELPQPQFIDKVVDLRVVVQRQVPQSKCAEQRSRCVSFSSATKWWIPVVQQRTDATSAVPERDAEANPSPESPEGDRDSTGSVSDKMVDIAIVPVHRSTSW